MCRSACSRAVGSIRRCSGRRERARRPGGGVARAVGGVRRRAPGGAAAGSMPGERIHTYAVRFTEPGYDESAYAEAVTHDIATVHHVVTADDESLGPALDVGASTLAEPAGRC